jgi:hypothetical protein
MSQLDSTLAYASAVRAALADLPAEHREVLLEDLEDHLAEIAAESDGSLEERLGNPEAYAAELRAAYGIAEARPAAPSSSDILARVGTGLTRLSRSRAWQEARRLNGELRPAWWLVRAYLLVIALAVFSGHANAVRGFPLGASGWWSSSRSWWRWCSPCAWAAAVGSRAAAPALAC